MQRNWISYNYFCLSTGKILLTMQNYLQTGLDIKLEVSNQNSEVQLPWRGVGLNF